MATRAYEIVIGIECHVELATRSKMFCSCSAKHFGLAPNALVCPVCLGLPGALPVPNKRAIELAMIAGMALNCRTPEHTKFDRKNYLYPDLPKGYQISQFDLPLSVDGWLEIPADGGGTKRVGIRRAHLEEDTGSLLHGEEAGARYTLIDFNRSGVPLLEIVSEPDLSSVHEALAYVQALREVVVGSGVSEFRLEEGAARFDTNVSIRFTEGGEVRWPPLSEIKNLNSYRALEEAATYEADRLWREWQAGGDIRRRTGKITVGWSPDRGETFLQRAKEDVDDYRYFPEPDLVALTPDPAWVASLRAGIPELPGARRARFGRDYGLTEYDARVLVSERAVADWYERAVAAAPGQAKAIANWVAGEVLRYLKEPGVPTKNASSSDYHQLRDARVQPEQLAALVSMIHAGDISNSVAKTVFADMWQTGAEPLAIVQAKGLSQVSDEGAIAAAVDAAILELPKAVADVRAGNARAIGALAGAVQKKMGGKANSALVMKLLGDRIKPEA